MFTIQRYIDDWGGGEKAFKKMLDENKTLLLAGAEALHLQFFADRCLWLALALLFIFESSSTASLADHIAYVRHDDVWRKTSQILCESFHLSLVDLMVAEAQLTSREDAQCGKTDRKSRRRIPVLSESSSHYTCGESATFTRLSFFIFCWQSKIAWTNANETDWTRCILNDSDKSWEKQR